MKILPSKLIIDFKSYDNYIKTNASKIGTNDVIPVRSFVISVRYLLKELDSKKSEISKDSVAQLAFDSSEYDAIDKSVTKRNFYKIFNTNTLSTIKDKRDYIDSLINNGNEEVSSVVEAISRYSVAIFIMLILSIQISNHQAANHDFGNITINFNKFVDTINDHSINTYRPLYSTKEFKSLLVYSKSLRRSYK